MTREELMQLTKEELNLALTPYMGGLIKQALKKAKKDELIDMLLSYIETEMKLKKRQAKSRHKSVRQIWVEYLPQGATIDEIVQETIKERKLKNPTPEDIRKIKVTVRCQLQRVKKQTNWRISYNQKTKIYKKEEE